jgi:hypothetical protein
VDEFLTVDQDAADAEAIGLELFVHNCLDEAGAAELRAFLASRLADERMRVYRRRARGERDPRMFAEVRRLTRWIGVVDDDASGKPGYVRPGKFRLVQPGAARWPGAVT